MKQALKKAVNRRHTWKWGALGGMLGSGTALLQYLPQTLPPWIGISLTVLAFAAAGVAHFVDPSDGV